MENFFLFFRGCGKLHNEIKLKRGCAMSELIGACLIAQSGGPTSVINASVYGAVIEALNSECITQVLGAAHGVMGILNDELFDLGREDRAELDLLPNTPASALGSCRHKLAAPEKDDTDYRRILEVFRRHNIRYFFYNGGNDSMDTCDKISRYFAGSGWDCRVMGIPKTIDNDLFGTDHCPGFGSAAKYIATTCMEVSRDAVVYDYKTATVIEIMGRNAGWLTAAAALSSRFGAGPDLIYLPETDFDLNRFLSEVKRILAAKSSVLVAVSEGIHDRDGVLISEYGSKNSAVDAFGHAQLGGLAAALAQLIQQETGVKSRGIELSLMQRCGAHLASRTDIDEAMLAGKTAVAAAVKGESGKMVAFRCSRENGYVCETELIPLTQVANVEKKIPAEWILPDGQGVTEEFIRYALPLIQGESGRTVENGLPRFAKLKFIRA